jgi:hypothetical protein
MTYALASREEEWLLNSKQEESSVKQNYLLG